MAENQAARSREAGVAVEILIDDCALRDRIIAALGQLPDVDVGRSQGEAGVPITIADSIEALRHASPDGPVIVLADRSCAWAALRAGAGAVLGRSAGPAELRVAIDALLQGLMVAPAGSAWTVEAELSDELPSRLTAREREVLALLATGASNKMIAKELAVSVHTAKFHVASILEKLDATGRTDAVAHAARRGLLML